MLICYSRKKDIIHNKNCQNVKQISYSNYMEEEIDEGDLNIGNLCEHCINKNLLERRLIEKIKKETDEKRKKQLENKLKELRMLIKLEKRKCDDDE